VAIVESAEGAKAQIDVADVRSRIFSAAQLRNRELVKRRQAAGANGTANGANGNGAEDDQMFPDVKEQEMPTSEVAMYVGAALVAVFALAGGIIWIILKFADDESPLFGSSTGSVLGEL